MKVTLARLSICPCGFSALKDAIPLGTEYEIDPGRTYDFVWTCGGCGKERVIVGVWTSASMPPWRSGFLPAEIFSNHPSNQNQKPN